MPITVHIEHCKDCHLHEWNSRHDEIKYIDFYEQLTQKIIQAFPEAQVGLRNPPSNLIKKRTPTSDGAQFVNMQTGQFVHFPRLGSFEVYVEGQRIFSKIKNKKWPKFDRVINKIKLLVQAQQEGEDLNKFDVDYVQVSETQLRTNKMLYDIQTIFRVRRNKYNGDNTIIEDLYPSRNSAKKKQLHRSLDISRKNQTICFTKPSKQQDVLGGHLANPQEMKNQKIGWREPKWRDSWLPVSHNLKQQPFDHQKIYLQEVYPRSLAATYRRRKIALNKIDQKHIVIQNQNGEKQYYVKEDRIIESRGQTANRNTRRKLKPIQQVKKTNEINDKIGNNETKNKEEQQLFQQDKSDKIWEENIKNKEKEEVEVEEYKNSQEQKIQEQNQMFEEQTNHEIKKMAMNGQNKTIQLQEQKKAEIAKYNPNQKDKNSEKAEDEEKKDVKEFIIEKQSHQTELKAEQKLLNLQFKNNQQQQQQQPSVDHKQKQVNNSSQLKQKKNCNTSQNQNKSLVSRVDIKQEEKEEEEEEEEEEELKNLGQVELDLKYSTPQNQLPSVKRAEQNRKQSSVESGHNKSIDFGPLEQEEEQINEEQHKHKSQKSVSERSESKESDNRQLDQNKNEQMKLVQGDNKKIVLDVIKDQKNDKLIDVESNQSNNQQNRNQKQSNKQDKKSQQGKNQNADCSQVQEQEEKKLKTNNKEQAQQIDPNIDTKIQKKPNLQKINCNTDSKNNPAVQKVHDNVKESQPKKTENQSKKITQYALPQNSKNLNKQQNQIMVSNQKEYVNRFKQEESIINWDTGLIGDQFQLIPNSTEAKKIEENYESRVGKQQKLKMQSTNKETPKILENKENTVIWEASFESHGFKLKKMI